MPPNKTQDEKYEELGKKLTALSSTLHEIQIFIAGNPYDQTSGLVHKFNKFETTLQNFETSIKRYETSVKEIKKLETSIEEANKKIDEITKQRDAVKWFMYGLFLTGTYGTFEFIKKIVAFLSEKLN